MRAGRLVAIGPLVAIGLVAVFLAAGCGGSDEGGSSAEKWADDVCSSITTWKNSVTSATDSLKGGNLSEDALRSAVDDVSGATSDFVDDVKGLGAPDTQAGQQAKESLDKLADNVDENVSTIQKAVDDASGGSGVLQALTTVSGTVSTMSAQLSSTVAELKQLDPGGELADAFDNASSCKELQTG